MSFTHRRRFLYITLGLVLCFSGALFAKRTVRDESLTAPLTAKKGDTCIQCHKDLGGALSKPVEEFEKSVHAGKGYSCNICHGGNPDLFDMSLAKGKQYNFIGRPTRAVITDFCGRGGCHATAVAQFKKGPHYISVLQTNKPNCTHCHGVHFIKRSTLDVISDKSCTDCHTQTYSREILVSIGEIEKGIKEVESSTDFLKEKLADVQTLKGRIDKVRHLYHQLVHVFSRDDVRSTKKIVELEVENLINESKNKLDLIQRLDLLYIVMFGIGLAIILGFSGYTLFMIIRRK